MGIGRPDAAIADWAGYIGRENANPELPGDSFHAIAIQTWTPQIAPNGLRPLSQ